MASEPKTRKRKLWRRAALGFFGTGALGFGLLCLNGLVLAHGEQPIRGQTGAKIRPVRSGEEVKVMAWNLAKCFVYRGGLEFAEETEVEKRLREIAAVIRGEDPDVVFLSEVVTECALCDVDHVEFLARETGLTEWAFGENYNFGWPFFRIVGGNAILSRTQLFPVANPDLAGRRSFLITKNNRRMLWCNTQIGNAMLLLGSVHTDSFDLGNNLRQTRQILEYCAGRPTILAGDFNARPDTASIAAVRDSGRFSGAFEGPQTFPADDPDRRIDYVFAPKGWTLLEHRVLPVEVSDHRPVVSVFRVTP